MSKTRRIQNFIPKYSEEFDFIKKSNKGPLYAFCTVCNCDFSISHGGRSDIMQHAATSKHASAFNKSKSNSKISSFMASESDNQAIKAELLFTGFILEHNIPLAAADHVSKLLMAMFPNSPEVKKYACGRTKSGYLVKEIANESTKRICDFLKKNPFSIATDGSNDADAQMYPLVVTYFDEVAQQVCCNLFSLPILNEECTGKNIAQLLINEFNTHSLPWENCVAFSCDNANVMIGNKKGVSAYIKEIQPNLSVCGCICHLINLAAEKGAKTLPVSFDDFLVDVFYYFKRSGKRKIIYRKFQAVFGNDEKHILKHCITRWLSLGKCLTRILEQWRTLLIFFKEECSDKVSFQPRLAAYNIPKRLGQQAAATTLGKKRKPISCASPIPVKKLKSMSSASPNKSAKKVKSVAESSIPVKKIKSVSSASSNSVKQLNSTSCASEKSVKKVKSVAESSIPVKKLKSVSSASPNSVKQLKSTSSASQKSVKKVKSVAQSTSSASNKSILQRKERIFLTLSSNLHHALAFFVKNVIAIYEKYNVMFQSEEPKIHKMSKELSKFFAELLARFVKVSVIVSSKCVFRVKFDIFENQKDDKDLVVGSETLEFIKELSESELLQFYSCVRNYYTTSCSYIVANFPHDSELLQHAEVADISKRQENDFSSVRYFVEKYPTLLLRKDDESEFEAIDALETEFLSFQLAEIPSEILAEERVDRQWANLSKEKDPLGKLKFEKLSRLMLGILTFPHSNAACERIFSLVRRNKTDFRSSLKPETLQAILVAKSRISEPCYKQTYDKQFLKKAKSCTHASLNLNATN